MPPPQTLTLTEPVDIRLPYKDSKGMWENHRGRAKFDEKMMNDLYIACALGSGTYLECSGCSIENHQSPSEMEMVPYRRKKSCQSIQPLRHYA